MLLFVNAYNRIINTLKHTAFEIINGHTTARPVNQTIFRTMQDEFLTTQYQTQIQKYYDQLYKIAENLKIKYIDKVNLNRHQPLKYEQSIVYRQS